QHAAAVRAEISLDRAPNLPLDLRTPCVGNEAKGVLINGAPSDDVDRAFISTGEGRQHVRLRACGHDHIENTGMREPSDARVLPNQLEIVGERTFPAKLLLLRAELG